MKKVILLIGLLASVCTLRAQDTINPFFMNSIAPTILRDSSFLFGIDRGGIDSVNYGGRCYTNLHFLSDTVVTGLNIAMKFSNSAVRDSLEVRGVLIMVNDRDFQHPITYLTRPVAAVSHRKYDHYMSLDHPSMCEVTDTLFPVYSLYFEHPIEVSDTVYLGRIITRQGCNYHGIGIVYRNFIGGCDFMREDFSFVDWLVDDSLQLVYTSGDWPLATNTFQCIFPIYTLPDTDSFSCPEVEGFAFAGINAGYPTFVWDTAGEHGIYQLAYGPYDAPMDSLSIKETTNRYLELTDVPLSRDVYYQARLRARCRHACPVHDTVMWTGWTAPVYFYTGDSMPDTAHHQPIGIVPVGAGVPFAIVPNPSTVGRMPDVVIGQGVALQGMTLTLHDAAGREVLHTAVSSHRFTLPVRSLPTGVYTATLSSPQGHSSLRVVIE